MAMSEVELLLPVLWEWTGRWTDKHSGYQIWSAAFLAEVFRGLRNFLNMDRPEHHSIDRLKAKGVEKGSGRHSTVEVENDLYSTRQTFILLRDGVERVWAFTSTTMPCWAEAETGLKMKTYWEYYSGQATGKDSVLGKTDPLKRM